MDKYSSLQPSSHLHFWNINNKSVLISYINKIFIKIGYLIHRYNPPNISNYLEHDNYKRSLLSYCLLTSSYKNFPEYNIHKNSIYNEQSTNNIQNFTFGETSPFNFNVNNQKVKLSSNIKYYIYNNNIEELITNQNLIDKILKLLEENK